MKDLLWVGLGGFLGANARYLFGLWIAAHVGTSFPYGTFVINVSGSFVLGIMMGLLDAHVLAPAVRLSLAIGFIGAYTTFSTFTYETLRLIEDGSLLLATANVLGSVVFGMLAAVVGLAAGRSM
jgi:CrcB protein